eukprot:scaffold31487_cov54-Phaeocystis_antarctica.AAC.2
MEGLTPGGSRPDSVSGDDSPPATSLTCDQVSAAVGGFGRGHELELELTSAADAAPPEVDLGVRTVDAATACFPIGLAERACVWLVCGLRTALSCGLACMLALCADPFCITESIGALDRVPLAPGT